MLVLSRKKDERILIGEDIEIVIGEIEDGKVKIGINAPKSIEIMRKEVKEEIAATNKAAADSGIDKDAVKKLLKNIKK